MWVWRRRERDRGLSFNFLHLFCSSPLEDERVTDERMMIEQCSEIALLLLLVRFHSCALSVIMMGILRCVAQAGKWIQSKFCYLSCHNGAKWALRVHFRHTGPFVIGDCFFMWPHNFLFFYVMLGPFCARLLSERWAGSYKFRITK